MKPKNKAEPMVEAPDAAPERPPIVQQNRIVTPQMVRVRAKFPIAETKGDGSVGRYDKGDEFEVTAERAKAIAPAIEIV